MASLASINIRFSADLKEFSSQMKNAERQLERTGKKLQNVGKSLTLGLTGPLSILGAQSIATFTSFEQEMAKVEAISGATSKQFKSLEKNARDLGETTRFTASEVAGLQLNYSKLGFNPSEILSATSSTLDLALATGEDLANSATVAASTLRGFGLSTTETGRVVDVMAKSFSSSALDLEKFSTAMSVLAPVAKTANVSLEEATGLLSVLVNAGIDASTAGVGLRNVFLDIADKGLTLDEALGQIQTSTNKNKTALELFGKRGATVANVLADNVDKAVEFSESYLKASGSASKMAKIMDDTLQGSFYKLKSAVEGASISIGELLAPTINSIADFVTELVSKFSNLDTGTKKIILTVSAFAAALGPAILVIGTLIRNISAIIPLIRALTVAIAANPIGAFAVAVTALAGGLLLANSRLTPLTDATKEFNELTAKATSNIAKEKAEMEKYLAIAQNDTLQKSEREKAIKSLNALSPEYLGNLTLEKINTDEATKATEAYTAALLQKAKIQAAEEKLVEVQKKLLDLQLGTNDAVQPSIWQNLGNALGSLGNAQNFLVTNSQQVVSNFKEEKTQLEQLQDQLTALIGTNDALNDSLTDTTKTTITPTLDLSKAKVEGQITTEDLIKFEALDADLAELNSRFVDFGQATEEALANAGAEGFVNSILEDFNTLSDGLDDTLEDYNAKLERMAEVGQGVSTAVAGAFETLSAGIVNSLKLADNGFQGFIKGLVATVTKLIAMMLASSISQAISGATASGSATGPAAVFTTPAFIATAVSGVLAAFAAIPKFETGGIVPGNSFYGDQILARVNSGELILNQRQQQALFNQLNSAEGTNVVLGGSLKVSGDELQLVLDRAQTRRNRRS